MIQIDDRHPLMKCGCAAQGTCSSMGGVTYDPPIPCCVVHDCIEKADPVILEGRKARCCYCKLMQPSSLDLGFFEYLPDKPMDRYYCGCRGWD